MSDSKAPAAASMDGPPLELKNDIRTSLLCPSCLACCLSLFPCSWCSACLTLNVRTERILLNYGRYMATLREPGCYCVNQCGTTSILISTARSSTELKEVKVADAKGNPLLISGVVTYQVLNSRKAALEVKNPDQYIRTQGLTVMKKIASMYPYESRDHKEPSLKSEADHLRTQMIKLLQERVDASGMHVINFELNDLSYAPEIAKAMLVRQQAEAMLDARRTIVEGAVAIAHGAIAGLGEKGLQFTQAEASRLVSNLLVTICSDVGVQPTMTIN